MGVESVGDSSPGGNKVTVVRTDDLNHSKYIISVNVL